MTDGPESAQARATAAAAVDASANTATNTTSTAQPVAAPAIDTLVSLFDELADRHIAAHDGDRNAPFGITAKMLADFRNRPRVSADELAQLASVPEEGRALARRILHDRVWEPILGDKLPPQLASILFDVAMRRGVDRAGKTLQKAAKGLAGTALKIDGALGRQTMLTLEQIDADDLAERLLAHRGTLVWRLFDGKLWGHDINYARAAIFAGKWALRARGIAFS